MNGNSRQLQSRAHVEIIMPKRPSCSGTEPSETQSVYVYMKPRNRSLYIRLDALDWLTSYAADEHFVQGILCTQEESDTAVADYRVEWSFNDNYYEGTVLVSAAAGQSWRCSPKDLESKSQWQHLKNMEVVEGFFLHTNRAFTNGGCQGTCEAVVRRHTAWPAGRL